MGKGGRMKDIEIVVFNDKSWVRFTEYQKVKEENERLKQQIAKMECCGNCKFQDMYGDCVLEAPIWCNRIYEGGSDEWELAE